MSDPSVAILGTRGYPSYYGGFETLVRRLAPYLAERGWEVGVYGRGGEIANVAPSEVGVQSILTPGLNSTSLSTISYGFTASLHSAFRKPDVALVMNVANGYWLPFFRARHIPTVVNVDGVEWERDKWGRQARRVFFGGAKMTARLANELIFDSRAIARLWKDEFYRSGSFIPYGGDPVDELPLYDNLRSRKYVLFVARLVPENSVLEFFTACGKLSEDFQVVIVGSSGYGGKFDQLAYDLAAKYREVKWYGHVSNDTTLNSLWQHAGVYFHGHTVGGTNPSLVQAMACGSPVVAVDTAYNREVLGGAGLLVKPDADAIVDQVSALMRDQALQEKIALLARNRASLEYSWKAVCREYENILRSAIEKSFP